MDLTHIAPLDYTAPNQRVALTLFRSLLMRTNFTPGPRHALGWRGLLDSSSPQAAAWTAKINGQQGVYGLEHDDGDGDPRQPTLLFRLHYFPHPDEALIEACGVRAGVLTHSPDYLARVRSFPEREDLRTLYTIGLVRFAMTDGCRSLRLGLEAATRQQVVAVDGITLPGENGPVSIVPPGGLDQDFPAWETALSFFAVLAASLTFCLEQPPIRQQCARRPGTRILCDAAGGQWTEPAENVVEERVDLDWGEAEDACPAAPATDGGRGGFQCWNAWRAGAAPPLAHPDASWWSAHRIATGNSLDKAILGIDERPQLIVLTGFLGAGKTTFLRGFLDYQEGMNRFVAVIQNEIGETGLDGKLLDREYAVTEIDEGCVCCSLAGNIRVAVHQIMQRFHPDCIVLETTGLANPHNLLDEVGALDDLVRFDSVTCVADASNVETCLDVYDVATGQIEAADIILLNKTDLVDEATRARVEARLRAINPAAPIVATVRGDVNPALLYGVSPQEYAGREALSPRRGRIDPSPRAMHAHAHDGLSSVKIDLGAAMDKEAFMHRLQALPDTVFRAKGIVSLAGHAAPVLLQYVAGRYEMSEYVNPTMAERFLVLIGRGIEMTDWNGYFTAC
ncbi:MAG: GTP-binding protein [Desulfovibrionaceae bacterium]